MALDNQKNLIELRTIAVKTLAQVYHSNQSLEQSFFEEITRKNEKTLPEFDRAWIYELCSGVLRFRGRVDHIIDTYALKKKPTGVLRRYLQTAVYQLLEQDAPSALVVSETVEAVRKSEGDVPSKFANAVLRKVAESRSEWKEWNVTADSPLPEQVAWSSLPEWLFTALKKSKGLEFTLKFAEACLKRPQTWYRDLSKSEPVLLAEGYRGDEPPGFVQDVSNQLLVKEVSEYLKRIAVEKGKAIEDLKILDLCSAPGGKSLGLAVAGFSVTATDSDDDRLQKVIENQNRLNLQKQITVVPYKKVQSSDQSYDLIWIDAPCSSTGIIRRHPEVKWNRTEQDIQRLISFQGNLLKWASDHLVPGGAIVYSTCSVLPKENTPALPGGLKFIQKWEWFPQDQPHGDAIYAQLLTNY